MSDRIPWCFRSCEFSSLQSLLLALHVLSGSVLHAGTSTWDGRHETDKIALTVAYFVPSDRTPLHDWQDRAGYYCRRIEQFHRREFQQQSTLSVTLHPQPVISRRTTAELRSGDANAISTRTLSEVEQQLEFPLAEPEGFPILLVLSEINWRPLDDFYRLKPQDGRLVFEGNYNGREHFPGATSGGSRASYLAERGVGWGLVSADGWRVPYRGSDCVIYHEGLGHTVGLPHPEPGNDSVMSLAQYRGWLSESWLDKDQKLRLAWTPDTLESPRDPQLELFTAFRALPESRVPRPGEPVTLTLDWPEQAQVDSLRVRFQTAIDGPWIDVPQQWDGDAPETASLGVIDRPTPVSYRIDTVLKDGSTAELWGYLQVRSDPDQILLPYALSPDLAQAISRAEQPAEIAELPREEIDLLQPIDPESCWQTGMWTSEEGKLLSPKQFGARLELPYAPPPEYRLSVIVEPLDPPNGLILGQKSAESRFVTLINFTRQGQGTSALENVDGRNVGNETTFQGDVFRQGRMSQVIVTVTRRGVTVAVDGRTIIHWMGDADQLSLSDYWKTPDNRALFVGAYDCRYRFHRITLEPITGTGTVLKRESPE
jgi:hypothetical protein